MMLGCGGVLLTGPAAQAASPALVAPAAGTSVSAAYVSDTAVIAADVTFTATVDHESPWDDDAELRVASSYSADNGLLTADLVVQETMAADASGSQRSIMANVRGLTGTFYWQVIHDGDASEIREFTLLEPAPTPPPSIKGTRSQLTPAGYRGMRVGMTLRKAARTGGVRFSRVQRLAGSDCAYAHIRRQRVSVMLNKGRIVRFETTVAQPGKPSSSVNGLGRIRVGDYAGEIAAVFGNSAAHTKHEYVVGGWYYDVDYTAGTFRGRSIRFETDATGRVTKVIVGQTAATKLVEGCA